MKQKVANNFPPFLVSVTMVKETKKLGQIKKWSLSKLGGKAVRSYGTKLLQEGKVRDVYGRARYKELPKEGNKGAKMLQMRMWPRSEYPRVQEEDGKKNHQRRKKNPDYAHEEYVDEESRWRQTTKTQDGRLSAPSLLEKTAHKWSPRKRSHNSWRRGKR